MKKLAIKYAKNRMDLRRVKKDIENLIFPDCGSHVEINLDRFRDDYYDTGEIVNWQGWVVALTYGDADYTHLEYALAELLDKKKQIIFEAGAIKRKIYCAGIKAINRKIATDSE